MLSHNRKDSNSKKRPLDDTIEDEPTPKMRKLAQGGVEHKDHKDGKHEEATHPVSDAMSGFFKLIHAVILCQVNFLFFKDDAMCCRAFFSLQNF